MVDEPIHMWDPQKLSPHASTQQHHMTIPTNDNYPTPVAIIKDSATLTQAHPTPYRIAKLTLNTVRPTYTSSTLLSPKPSCH
jgi:hypothetical protein